jgi:hypothetical protein
VRLLPISRAEEILPPLYFQVYIRLYFGLELKSIANAVCCATVRISKIKKRLEDAIDLYRVSNKFPKSFAIDGTNYKKQNIKALHKALSDSWDKEYIDKKFISKKHLFTIRLIFYLMLLRVSMYISRMTSNRTQPSYHS